MKINCFTCNQKTGPAGASSCVVDGSEQKHENQTKAPKGKFWANNAPENFIAVQTIAQQLLQASHLLTLAHCQWHLIVLLTVLQKY